MALSPQRIRDTRFKGAKRGYDQGEVDAFVEEVASALETAQNEATAMEARARAAVARLQELSQAPAETVPAAPESDATAVEEPRASVDESETISRTLLLAQRTADTTVAEAQAEADRVLAASRDEASSHLDAAREETARLIEDARVEARRAGESERVQVEGEVQALLARRDFLESDVDHLEQYLIAQRERIVEAVSELSSLVQRIPGGLGDMRRPLMSAAAGEPESSDDGDEPGEDGSELAEITKVANADDGETVDEAAEDLRFSEDVADDAERASSPGPGSLFDDGGAPTEQIDVTKPSGGER